MQHSTFQQSLSQLWDKGVKTYGEGKRNPQEYFDEAETGFLLSIGMNAQEMFDFVEDFLAWGEPDFDTVLMIQDTRRSYLLEKQAGKLSTHRVDMSKLPPKKEELDGIVWLPRVIEKAKAKLRGEMPAELMFCCGGDRDFFKTNDIHPAEFLKLIAENKDDTKAIIDWVKARSRAESQ